MTLGMQVRAWAREASRGQVIATAGALLVAVSLVAVSVAPTGNGGSVAAGDALDSGFDPGEAGDGAGGPGGVPVDTDGDGVPDSVPGSTAGGAAGTRGAGTATSGRAGAPGSGGGPGGGPGGGGGGGGEAVRRTASEVGVTADEILLGVGIINIGPAAEAGYAVGLRQDQEAVIKAIEKHINDNGGVAGRRLKTVTRRTDVTSQSDQNAACTYFAEDKKVYAIIDTVTFSTEATQRCVTYEKKIPLIHVYALTEDLQNGARGLDVTGPKNSNRIAREWVQGAIDQGFLKGGEAVGVLARDCDTVIEDDLVPMIRRTNPTKVVVRKSPCLSFPDPATVTSDVLAMYSEGVTHIFPASGATSLAAFTKEAELQRPPGRNRFQYFVSEYLSVTDPNSEKLYDPDQVEGMRGVIGVPAAHPTGEDPLAAPTKRCSDIVEAAGLPGMKFDSANSEVLALCDEFLTFLLIMRHAGPNPTRASFAAAVPRVGAFTSALNPIATLGRNKYSAADGVTDIRWQRDCTCFMQVSSWRPGKH